MLPSNPLKTLAPTPLYSRCSDSLSRLNQWFSNRRDTPVKAVRPAVGSKSKLKQHHDTHGLVAIISVAALGCLATFVHSLAALATIALVIVATATDLTRHKIYNKTTYPAVCLGLALAAAATVMIHNDSSSTLAGRVSEASLMSSVAGTIGCSVAMFVAYLMSGGGAGDVKIAAALGALLGLHAAMAAVAAAYIIAAIVIIAQTIASWLRGQFKHQSSTRRLDRAIPMGGYFAAGVALVLSEVL